MQGWLIVYTFSHYHLSTVHYNLNMCVSLITIFYAEVKMVLHHITRAMSDTDSSNGRIFFSVTDTLPKLKTQINHSMQGHHFSRLLFSKFHHIMNVQTIH